jgi:hypothetical protein
MNSFGVVTVLNLRDLSSDNVTALNLRDLSSDNVTALNLRDLSSDNVTSLNLRDLSSDCFGMGSFINRQKDSLDLTY